MTSRCRCIRTFSCIHRIPPHRPVAAGEFLKLAGKPVYQCRYSELAPASAYVHATLGHAERDRRWLVASPPEEETRELHVKHIEVKRIDLPEPLPETSTQRPCEKCPRRCLWPGCGRIVGDEQTMAWHQARAHGMWQPLLFVWDYLPPELWAVVAAWMQPITIFDVEELIPLLWLSKSHPLCQELRDRVTKFLYSVEKGARSAFPKLPLVSIDWFASGLLIQASDPKRLVHFLLVNLAENLPFVARFGVQCYGVSVDYSTIRVLDRPRSKQRRTVLEARFGKRDGSVWLVVDHWWDADTANGDHVRLHRFWSTVIGALGYGELHTKPPRPGMQHCTLHL